MIGHHRILVLPVDVQPLAKEVRDRSFQEARQLLQRQFLGPLGMRQHRPSGRTGRRRVHPIFRGIACNLAPFRSAVSMSLLGLLQRLPPFVRVAEQIISTRPCGTHSAFLHEIRPTEGLQAMLCRQCLQQCFSRFLVMPVQPPPGGDMVTQLRHQHRRRTWRVVMDAAPHPADGELLTGRQQCFQEQIAIILTA